VLVMSRESVTYRHLEIYSRNYHRLLLLFPELEQGCGDARYHISGGVQLETKICERTRYTTVLYFVLRFKGCPHWFPDVIMNVRAYHDARVTEVVAYQRQRWFNVHRDSPNPNVLSCREKRRVNEFFGRCLDFCLGQRQKRLAAVR